MKEQYEDGNTFRYAKDTVRNATIVSPQCEMLNIQWKETKISLIEFENICSVGLSFNLICSIIPSYRFLIITYVHWKVVVVVQSYIFSTDRVIILITFFWRGKDENW